MAAPEFSITYIDGNTEQVKRRPIHLMRAEQICKKDAGANEQLLASLWAAATGGKTGRAAFEAWCETVEDWDRVAAVEAEDDADPLVPASGGSPD